MLNFLKGRREKVVIFGTGVGGSSFFRQQRRRFKVLAFADNNPQKQGSSFLGRRVYSAEQISDLAYDKIIIASDYHTEIYQQLVNEFHIPAEKIALFHEFQSQSSFWQSLPSYWHRWAYQAICSSNPIVANIFFRLLLPTVKARNGMHLMPLCWLDKYEEGQIQIFKTANRVKISGPASKGAPVSSCEVMLPAMAMYHFEQGVFSSTSRSVLLKDNKLILERVSGSKNEMADYAGGQVVYHSTHRALVRVAEQPSQLAMGILVNGVSETNYYHWLLEILSQLYFVKQLPADYADIPLLMSAHAEKIPAVAAIIAAIQLPQKIIYLSSATSYQVNSLYLINSPCFFVTHFKTTATCQLEDYYADADALRFIREAGLNCAASVDLIPTPKRIFLARKQSLRPYNQDEIWQLLADFGFIEVYLEDLSFAQQVVLISQAEVIVGPTGAAWSNLLFATSGTKALCWMPKENGDFACFSHLAALFSIQLDYIRYSTGIHDSRALYYHRYKIDPEQVNYWLQQLV